MAANRLRRLVVALCLVGGWSAPSAAQVPEATPPTVQKTAPPPVVPEVSAAQRVLLAAYPELRQGRMAWLIARGPTGLRLEVREALLPLAPAADVRASATTTVSDLAMSTEPLVRAAIELDQDGALTALRLDGTLARPVAFDILQTAATTTLVNADTTDALRAAGAQFPPGDAEAAATLVPAAVTTALGARLETVAFQSTGTDGEALTWRAALVTPTTLVFEPMQGRLLSLVRQ